MSMRNGVTPKLKLTLTLTLTDTEGAVLTLMLGYTSLYITSAISNQQSRETVAGTNASITVSSELL